ncbi:hypothetical protein K9M09_01575 [Patescibacteria group bacterium]|nr:hypothetical protein [Patescibacteria group bacterium]
MCYFAEYQGTEVAFEQDNIFKEKKQILVKHPKNCSDCDDKTLPRAVPLHELKMPIEDREKIKNLFQKKKTEKINSKLKKHRISPA